MTQVFILATGSYVIPSGVTSLTIDAIGGGAGGNAFFSSSKRGGGGGEWRRITGLSVTPGNSYTAHIGAGGAGVTTGVAANNGGNTYFGATTTINANGGTLAGGTGGTGAGGNANGGSSGSSAFYAAGGGGAGGPHGVGGAGGTGNYAGGGGGGNGGGTAGGAGGTSASGLGGAGGNAFGGTGGGAGGTTGNAGSPGTVGGGGGGGGKHAGLIHGGAGSTGVDFDSSHGSGGGGGGAGYGPGSNFSNGGDGGKYGGGGGCTGQTSGTGGSGAQGLLVLNFTAASGAITGTLNVNQAAQTIAAAGGPVVRGTLSAPQAANTIIAAGGPIARGILGVNQAAQTIVAAAGPIVRGTLTAPQAANTIAATGSVVSGASAALSVNQAPQTLAAAAGSIVRGTLSAPQAANTIVAAGSPVVRGTLTAPQAANTIAATGSVVSGASAALARPQAPQTLAASGIVIGAAGAPSPLPFYFAWTGGIIIEQTTLVTSGVTHGYDMQTTVLVGDAAGRQMRNLGNLSGLEAGAYYELAGAGIVAGTRFMFDDSILSGLPHSLNLSASAGIVESGTFTATKSVPVGIALGTLTQGSPSVSFTGLSLAAGTYGIVGTGIGETDEPLNMTEGSSYSGDTGVMIVPSCWCIYNGAGGGTLRTYSAWSVTDTGTDDFGQATKITTYTVVEQDVRATTSGQFPLQLSGFPTDDPALVTGIPGTALAGLEPGLVYNVGGNGIPIGATFVAPASGTSITLDQPATTADQAAILTITGPRTPNAPFDPLVHNRFDEEVISLEISQTEGELATLTVTIRNPNIGLLALGRNLWVWLSWDQAWPTEPPDLVPLFNGRLIGVPRLSAGELVELQFLARPDDFMAQKLALSESLSVLPWYDPVWIAGAPSADTALEARSALYHIDRTTLAVTTSDILEGEDGILDIGEHQSIYDRFSLAYGEPPLKAVTVEGTVSWQQQAVGSLDITDTIVNAFYKAGSGYSRAFARTPWNTGGGAIIQSLVGDGLKSDWPKPGTTIGGGWSLTSENAIDGQPYNYIIDASKTNKGGWLDPAVYRVNYTAQAPPDPEAPTSLPPAISIYMRQLASYQVDFPLHAFKIRFTLDYRADRKRTETITAVAIAGVQRELSDPAESDRETVSLTSEFVGQAVEPDGSLPIGSLTYRSYFQTDRGARSFEHLLMLARAKMRARARAVDITFAVDWRTALPLTLRHSVRYADRRVSGGLAIGKVKSYRLTVADGTMTGEFTIGCSIGTGELVAPLAGEPAYVDDGYVMPGYQAMTGAQTELVAGEGLAYQSLTDFVIIDDGLSIGNLTAATAINECVVRNGVLTQMTALAGYQNTVAPHVGDPISKMKTLKTRVFLDLKPVAGSEYHTPFYPAVTPLVLPMTIDLSAGGA